MPPPRDMFCGASEEQGISMRLRYQPKTSAGTHSDGALVRAVLCRLGLGLDGRCLCGPGDTADDVRHGAGSARAEHLDGNEVGVLCDAVLGGSDRAGAVRAVAISIEVDVVWWWRCGTKVSALREGVYTPAWQLTLRHGLAPLGAALELDVVHVDSAGDARGTSALVTNAYKQGRADTHVSMT